MQIKKLIEELTKQDPEREVIIVTPDIQIFNISHIILPLTVFQGKVVIATEDQ